MKVSDLIKQMYEPQPDALKVISLGWGVQSWTIAAMVALGELPPVDFAIHADTTHEASWTYAEMLAETEHIKKQLEKESEA